MNLPNLLSLSRILMVPILMLLLLQGTHRMDEIAAGVFLLSSITDMADGYLARRLKVVTSLGKLLDPLADKVLILAVLFVLVQEALVPAWVGVVILSRELLITLIRTVAASQGTVIAATPFGKTKTVSQVAAVELLILQRPFPVLQPGAAVMIGIAVVFTVYSGLDYLWRYRRFLGL